MKNWLKFSNHIIQISSIQHIEHDESIIYCVYYTKYSNHQLAENYDSVIDAEHRFNDLLIFLGRHE